MDSEAHAAKHLGIGDRQRRFDADSKFGGRGGHTLSIARPKSHVPEPACGSISVSGTRLPRELHGAAALSKAAELEAGSMVKSMGRNPDCPDVIVTTYLAEQGGAEFTVSRPSTTVNTRRYARGFDLVHMGCSRCGKNRGPCSAWKGRTKVRRHRLRGQIASAIGAEMMDGTCVEPDMAAEAWDAMGAVDPRTEAAEPADICPAAAAGTRAREPAHSEVGAQTPGAAAPAEPAPALEREDSWVVVVVPLVFCMKD